MTQSPSQPPNDPRRNDERLRDQPPATGPLRPLSFDEMVAMFVAFLSLGGVLFWGLTRGEIALFDDASTVANLGADTARVDGRLGAAGIGLGDEGAALPEADTIVEGEPDFVDDAVESAIVEPAPEGSARRELAERAAARRARLAQRQPMWRDGVAGAAAGVAGVAATADGASAEAPDAAAVSEPESPEATAEAPAGEGAAPSAAATAEPQEAIAFTDVPDDYWAKPYIDALSSRDLIAGYDDGSFRPDQPVTRAQIANIVSRTFDLTADKADLEFSDVTSDYWARESIGESVKGGFMTGFPDDTFAPNQPVTRAQSLTTLVTGLGIAPPTNIQAAIDRYEDANAIPNWATEKVAAATAGNLVVNYPEISQLNPTEPTSRAELSAMIYQALVEEGVVEPIESQYVVKP
ncbi:MAG: S-layer homology domain-containing protein [Cyanobacteria bacterium J06614_10]